MVSKSLKPSSPRDGLLDRRGAVGRSDLLRALVGQGEDGLRSLAVLLGYEEEQRPVKLAQRGLVERAFEAVRTEGSIQRPDEPVAMAPVPFWRFEAVEHLDEPTVETVDSAVLALEPEDLEPEGKAPEPAPIVPWPRLWPALHRTLRSAVPSREVDADALVGRWSRGEALSRLPWRDAFAWSRRVTVALDRSRRLIPFWHDQDELCRRLRRTLGRADLRVVLGSEGAWGPWFQGRGYRTPGPSAAAAGETVLVLGDLGFYGVAEQRAAWARLARTLRRNGVRTRALVACPASRWAHRVARLWNGVDWSSPLGAGRTAPRPDEGVLERRRERLLALVSSVLRVEPGLLRAVRRLLPATEADVGTEADVWSHPEVDGGSSRALRLEDSVTERRDAFRHEDVELRGKVIDEIRRWHAAVPREIWLEEALAVHATGGGDGGALPPDEVRQARRFALRLCRTVERPPSGSRLHRAAERYLVRFGRRQPEEVWDDAELGRPLARAWGVVLRADPEQSLPPGATPAILGPDAPEEERLWTVWQEGAELVFRPTGEVPDGSSGSPLATMLAARPEICVAAGSTAWQQHYELDMAPNRRPLPRAPTIVLTTDRARVELRRFVPPTWASVVGRDRVGLWATVEVEDVSFRFRWIPPGRFRMGSPDDEEGRWADEGPQHEVTLTRGFWLADTPCTQALWEAVTGENPSRFKSSSDRPVEQVSWDDCQGFLKELNVRVPGLEARLPTEAEWEYACRASTETSRYSPDLDKIAWYGDNSGNETHPVALKESNGWGLYDMLGNVDEWCMDYWKGSYNPQPATDPTGPAEGSKRVYRGGSWFDDARDVRAAYRHWYGPGVRGVSLGFRLARGQGEEG